MARVVIVLISLCVFFFAAEAQDYQKPLPPVETIEFQRPQESTSILDLTEQLEIARVNGDRARAMEVQRRIDEFYHFDASVTAEWQAQLPNAPTPPEEWDGRVQGFYQGPIPRLPEERTSLDWGDDITIASGNLWGTPAVTSSPSGVLYVAAVNLTTLHQYLIFRSTNGGRNWTTFFNSLTLADSINYVDMTYVSGGGTDSLIVVRDGWNSTDNYRMHCVVISVATGSNVRQTTIATSTGAYRNLRIVTDNINYPPASTYFYLVYQFSTSESSFRRSTDFNVTWSAILYTMSSVVNPDIDYGRNAAATSQLFFVGQQGPAPQRQIAMAYTNSFGTGTWVRDTLTTSTSDDYDPTIAVSNSDSVRYVVYTNNYFNSGDLDTWCAYTTNSGTSWTRVSIDFTTDTTTHPIIHEQYASTRFYRVVYVRETSVINNLLYRSSSAPVPSWTAVTVVSDNDVAGENSPGIISTVRPAIGESGGNGRIFYVSWAGSVLYTDGFEFVSVNDMQAKPVSFVLEQNYPNPFNPTTEIRYTIAETAPVRINVFDLLGQEVATLVNETKPAGSYTVTWDAGSVASGIYFYRLTAGGFTAVRKMIVVK